MDRLLKIGQEIKMTNNRKCIVESFLGGGTQGEVYKVKINDSEFALKWYYKATATRELYDSLVEIAGKGAPTQNFLWPLEVIKKDNGNFGYLMNLRPKEYKGLNGWATKQFRMDFKQQILACLELADSFHHLHSKGWSYQDISFGNIFINPETGKILICDNDNVTIHGKTVGNVMGTPRFMAPEIVLGKAKPSMYTDQFSLTVLLFYIMMMSHPLEGKKEAEIKCFDIPAMNRIYGEEPIFIFDPNNSENRPVQGIHNNAIICWDIYPDYIKKLFIKAFTKGLNEPQNGRIRESQWQKAFSMLFDSITYCPNCGVENFYDLENEKDKFCCNPKCKKIIKKPIYIEIDWKKVIINSNSKIFEGHVNPSDEFNYHKLVGEITQNPNNPQIWGIKNVSCENWSYTNIENQIIEIAPGKAATIKPGCKINFGKVVGNIK